MRGLNESGMNTAGEIFVFVWCSLFCLSVCLFVCLFLCLFENTSFILNNLIKIGDVIKTHGIVIYHFIGLLLAK